MSRTNWTRQGFDGELIFQPSFELLHDFFEKTKESRSATDRVLGTDVIVPYDIAWPMMADISEGIKNVMSSLFALSGLDNTPRRKEGGLVLNGYYLNHTVAGLN